MSYTATATRWQTKTVNETLMLPVAFYALNTPVSFNGCLVSASQN